MRLGFSRTHRPHRTSHQAKNDEGSERACEGQRHGDDRDCGDLGIGAKKGRDKFTPNEGAEDGDCDGLDVHDAVLRGIQLRPQKAEGSANAQPGGDVDCVDDALRERREERNVNSIMRSARGSQEVYLFVATPRQPDGLPRRMGTLMRRICARVPTLLIRGKSRAGTCSACRCRRSSSRNASRTRPSRRSLRTRQRSWHWPSAPARHACRRSASR